MKTTLCILLVACQPYRVLYQSNAAYVTGAAGPGAPVYVGLSTGEVAEYSSREEGKLYGGTANSGNIAAGAFSMRATARRVLWMEPAGTAQMVDISVIPSVPVPLGTVLALASFATGAVWLASGGGLFQIDDSAEEASMVAGLAGLAPQQDPPVLASDGTFVYFVTAASTLKRYSLSGRALDMNYSLELGARVLGLHVDQDVYVALDSGHLDSRLGASGIIGPAKLVRIDAGRMTTVSETAASQGARSNVWVVSDTDYFYWCDVEADRTRAQRTKKKDSVTRMLGDQQGCPFSVTTSELALAAPGAVMLLAK